MDDRLPYGRLGLLGWITITVYGCWYYTFGAILDSIIADTGWSEAGLTAAFAIGGLITGIGALWGGWLLDRIGSRLVFGIGAVAGFVAFQAAAAAPHLIVFSATSVVGGGLLGAMGFYHVTQAVAVRISPAAAHRAIAIVTMWGAFASAIYLPLAAWLVADHGWRFTLRVTTSSAAIVLLLGAVLITPESSRSSASPAHGLFGAALRNPTAVRFLAGVALAGVAISIVLVYQIPAMTAAGLSLSAAASVAGMRGVMQLAGRLPIMRVVAVLGTARSLRGALLLLAASIALLPFSSTLAVAVAFAVAAGVAIGAYSPLQGMQATEEFHSSILGSALGVVAFTFALGGAAGPLLGGFLAESTGSRVWPVISAAVAAALAALLIRPAFSARNL